MVALPGAAQGSPRGLFVTLEGVDGAGKSTQIRLLADSLRENGREVVTTREPGGSPGAEQIRALLVEGAPGRWSAETETLLFAAARRDHVERTVRPALDRAAVVLCDRYVDSTRAYQAAGRGADPAFVDALHRLAVGLDPDLTLILDIDPSEAAARSGARGGAETRFEGFGLSFQTALRAAFHAIAAAAPDRCAVIDATGAPGAVAARLRAAVAARLGV
jgi:dTMP kinase